MERLHALYMLYSVEASARAHNHADIVAWCHKEIHEHAAALAAGEHTQPAEDADE